MYFTIFDKSSKCSQKFKTQEIIFISSDLEKESEAETKKVIKNCGNLETRKRAVNTSQMKQMMQKTKLTKNG